MRRRKKKQRGCELCLYCGSESPDSLSDASSNGPLRYAACPEGQLPLRPESFSAEEGGISPQILLILLASWPCTLCMICLKAFIPGWSSLDLYSVVCIVGVVLQ